MKSQTEVVQRSTEEMLKEVGAWHTGHFLLTSGLHSDQYVQCQRIMQFPRYGQILASRLADKLESDNLWPTAVVGPALGAIHWAVFVASQLDARSERPVRAIFAERGANPADPSAFSIRRGVELDPTDKVLVVEDVTTTGGSALKVVELVRALGADPIAVGAIVDRSGGTVSFGLPFVKLLTLTLGTYEPEQCPLCKQGSVAVKPGSSKK